MRCGMLIRLILTLSVSLAVFASCSSKGQDEPYPVAIRFYPYGLETPYSESGTYTVSRYIEIRVIDNTGQTLTTADLLVSSESFNACTSFAKNSDGQWVFDPTGKTILYARAGDVAEVHALNTDNLIKIDPSSSTDFNGQEPPEYQGPYHAANTITLTPNTLLDPSNVPLNLYHVLYQVDSQNTRTKVEQVPYNAVFSLYLGNYSNVTQPTTFVFKNTLAIIENNRIVYETAMSSEATVIFYY